MCSIYFKEIWRNANEEMWTETLDGKAVGE